MKRSAYQKAVLSSDTLLTLKFVGSVKGELGD